ncbi:bnl family protein [Megaselia abdita]
MLMLLNYRRKWRALVILGALLSIFFAWPVSFAMPATTSASTTKMGDYYKNYKFLNYSNAAEANHTEVLGSSRSDEQYYNSQRIKENNFIYNKRKRKKILDILRTRKSRKRRRWLLVVEPQVHNSDMLSEMFTSISENDINHHQLLNRSKRTERSINSSNSSSSSNNSRTKIRRLKVNNRNISNLERNERSLRELKQKRLLFGGHYMQILPNGVVSGTTDANDYTIIERSSYDVGVLKIRGVATCLYLCMNSCGHLYGSNEFNTNDCLFNETLHTSQYYTYSSRYHSNSHKVAYVAFNRNKTRVTRLEPNKNYAALSKYISAFLLNIPSKSIIDELKTRNFGANRIEHGFKQLCDSAERLRNLTSNEMHIPTCTAGQQHHHKVKGKKASTTTKATTKINFSSTTTTESPTTPTITTTTNKTPGKRKCEKGNKNNNCELRPAPLKQPKRVCKHIKIKEEKRKCLQERRRQMRKSKKEKRKHGRNIVPRSTPSTTTTLTSSQSTTPTTLPPTETTTTLRFLSQILNVTSESDSDVYSNNDEDTDGGNSDETLSHINQDDDHHLMDDQNLDNDDSLLRNVNFTSDGDYSYDDDYVS